MSSPPHDDLVGLEPEKAGRDQAGRFAPGASGNPSGKPRGTRHRITSLAEQMMGDDAERVVRAVIEAAAGGDMIAARLVLDRIAPARKGAPVTPLDLPAIATASDLITALGAVVSAVTAGDNSPEEAQALASVFENQRRAVETFELEARIAALEVRSRSK